MPSPFPGMDPFIEGQKWRDFHLMIIAVTRELLGPLLLPRYVVVVEEHVFLSHPSEDEHGGRWPDMFVLEQAGAPPLAGTGGGTATAVAIAPVTLTLPEPRHERQPYLTILDREQGDVITVLEVLSPTNKSTEGNGHRQYLEKRDEILESPAHLVELDLLRGGLRLPTVEPLPLGDYYAFVSRRWDRPRVDVYAWPLRHVLPPIPIPLAREDPEVTLDLQAAFTTAYDRALYAHSLRYRRDVVPPLSEADAAWVRELQGTQAPSTA
jgi:hypothetical protein